MNWFKNFFSVSASDTQDPDDQTIGGPVDNKEEKPSLFEGFKNFILGFALAWALKLVAVAVIPSTIGIVWSFIASFCIAFLLLGALGLSMKKGNPYIGGSAAIILVILFIIRMANFIGDYREAGKEEEKEETKNELVIVPTPPLSVVSDTIVLKLGDNYFDLLPGESTPALKFPACSEFSYAIDSEKKSFGVLVSGHNEIYGYDDQIPYVEDPVMRIVSPESDRIKFSVIKK